MITEQIKKIFGNRICEIRRFGGRRELYVEFPIGDETCKLLALMENNGYTPISERTVARNRYLTYITDEGVMYICIADRLGCIRIYVDNTNEPYMGTKETETAEADAE